MMSVAADISTFQLHIQLDDSAVFGYDILLNFGIIRFFAVAVISGAIALPAIIAAIFYALFRNLRALQAVMSRKTYALHRNLIFSLGIQVSDGIIVMTQVSAGSVTLRYDLVSASNNISDRSVRYAKRDRWVQRHIPVDD